MTGRQGLRRRVGRRRSSNTVDRDNADIQQRLRKLVATLLRLDLCAFAVIAKFSALAGKDRLAEIEIHFDELWDWNRGHPQPPAGLIEQWLSSEFLFPPSDDRYIPGFYHYVDEQLTEAQHRQIIANTNRKAHIYYIRMLRDLRNRLEAEDFVNNYLTLDNLDQAFRLNMGLLHGERPESAHDYRRRIIRNRDAAKQHLSNCLDAVDVFLAQVAAANEAGALDDDLLSSVRAVTRSLSVPYNNAITQLEEGERHRGGLLNPDTHLWLVDQPDLPAESESRVLAVLAAWFVFVCIISYYPALLQFENTQREQGERSDADFSGLVSQAILLIMSLLLVTLGFTRPLALGLAPRRRPGWTVYAVASLTLLSSWVGLLVYLLVSASWGVVVSFTSQLFAALLQLLLIFIS